MRSSLVVGLVSAAPIEATIPYVPTAVIGTDRRNHLVYELHLTNFAPAPMTLNRLDVLAGGPGERTIATFSADAIDAMISHPGMASSPNNPRVFVWLTWNPQEPAPRALLHRLSLSAP